MIYLHRCLQVIYHHNYRQVMYDHSFLKVMYRLHCLQVMHHQQTAFLQPDWGVMGAQCVVMTACFLLESLHDTFVIVC